ncbi:MAG: hypothetical protein HQL97_13635 [Magnetococcales bacterium]|nr:hypothetical protein [Magnetococcales bacterium]
MDKRLILAGLIGWMSLLPMEGWSFAVGEIAVQSPPGKKFQAEIPLRLVEGEKLKLVKLGSKADYKVMGLNRAQQLNDVRVETLEKDGETRIRLTSNTPLNPKGFDLLLRVTSTRQTNFPVFRIAGSAAKPEGRDKEPPAVEAKTGVELKKSEIKPPVESRPADPKPVVEARAEEPKAEAKGSAKPAKGQTASESPAAPGKQYGPVKEGDTLTSIARGLVSSRSVTIYQIMSGIYERNPEHFLLGNMNNLISGGMLTIPSVAEARAIPDRWARAMCLSHTKAWEQTLAGQNVPPPPQTALLASSSPEAGKIPASEAKSAASGREEMLILPDTTPPRAQLQSVAAPASGGLENVLVRLQGQLGELTEVLKQNQAQQAKLDTRVASLEMARGDQEALARRVAVLEQGVRDLSGREVASSVPHDGAGDAVAEGRGGISWAWGVLFALLGLGFAGVLVWMGQRWNRQAQMDGLKHLLAVTARDYPELATEVIREVESRKMPFIPSIHPGKLEGGTTATEKKVVHDGDLLRNVNRLNALNPKRGEAE